MNPNHEEALFVFAPAKPLEIRVQSSVHRLQRFSSIPDSRAPSLRIKLKEFPELRRFTVDAVDALLFPSCHNLF